MTLHFHIVAPVRVVYRLLPQNENEVSLANEQLKLALPYFEKAHQLNSKDLDTVRSLKEIYTRLKMYENANEMKELLEKK